MKLLKRKRKPMKLVSLERGHPNLWYVSRFEIPFSFWSRGQLHGRLFREANRDG